MKTIAVTGHRPEKVGGHGITARRALGAFAAEQLRLLAPDYVITGMALGWDQAIAAGCVLLGIPFTAAVPFEGQERRWPPEAQERYHRLLSFAGQRVVVCDEFTPAVRALQKRNEWMVDHAEEVIALWDGSFGGTHNCITYARKKGVPVTNLWDRWQPELRDLLG